MTERTIRIALSFMVVTLSVILIFSGLRELEMVRMHTVCSCAGGELGRIELMMRGPMLCEETALRFLDGSKVELSDCRRIINP